MKGCEDILLKVVDEFWWESWVAKYYLLSVENYIFIN